VALGLVSVAGSVVETVASVNALKSAAPEVAAVVCVEESGNSIPVLTNLL
jgi:hypothetical protein